MDLLATPAGPGTSQIVTRLRVARSHVPGGLNPNGCAGRPKYQLYQRTLSTEPCQGPGATHEQTEQNGSPWQDNKMVGWLPEKKSKSMTGLPWSRKKSGDRRMQTTAVTDCPPLCGSSNAQARANEVSLCRHMKVELHSVRNIEKMDGYSITKQ